MGGTGVFVSSIPFNIFVLLFSLLSGRNVNPGSQSRLFSLIPTTVPALRFLSPEDFSPFFPRRLPSVF